MINYIYIQILLFLFVEIKITYEKEIIEKHTAINLNKTNDKESKNYLIYDYCNIGQSQITIQFFNELFEFFNSSNTENNQCFILDEIFKYNNF